MTKDEVKQLLERLGVQAAGGADEVVAEVEAWKESVDTKTRRKMRVVCVVCGIVCFALGMGVSALLL